MTGIDLPGEVQGRVDSLAVRDQAARPDPNAFPNTAWYTGDNVEMAFGQGGTFITPIEQAVAYTTFANGGTRYAPQVAAAVVTPRGKVIKKFAPQVTGHVTLSPSTYQALLPGSSGVVQRRRYHGTAYGALQGLNFPGGLAGKTGTADTEGGKEPTAWFVGFGPDRQPPVRGGLCHRPGRIRGHGGGPGGPGHLQLPGRPPGRAAGRPARRGIVKRHPGGPAHHRRRPPRPPPAGPAGIHHHGHPAGG